MPPHQAHTIVHGDYKIDNLMYDHAIPKAIAVFDWEMATIGDPLADLGYYLNTWAPPKPLRGFEDRPPIRAGIPQMEGFPTIQEIQARYEERSGRSMKDLLFYRALASYKGVVIIEGLYMHYIEGAAANPAAADFEWRVPMQIAALQQLIEDGE
jgi:aminoglycoside phosphotransferase (APT) family kinase protein